MPPPELPSGDQGPPEPPPPPPTHTPATLNQQININQLPPTLWDKLDPQQTRELTSELIGKFDEADARRIALERERLQAETNSTNLAVLVGFLLIAGGLGLVGYLAVQGKQEVALAVGSSLVTLVSVVVGRRWLR